VVVPISGEFFRITKGAGPPPRGAQLDEFSGNADDTEGVPPDYLLLATSFYICRIPRLTESHPVSRLTATVEFFDRQQPDWSRLPILIAWILWDIC
jgi:hypothetical protein